MFFLYQRLLRKPFEYYRGISTAFKKAVLQKDFQASLTSDVIALNKSAEVAILYSSFCYLTRRH